MAVLQWTAPLVGREADALAELQAADRGLAKLGEAGLRATNAAELALAAAVAGQDDLARRSLATVDEIGIPGDVVTDASAAVARSQLALAAGDAADAVKHADVALAALAVADSPHDLARAHAARARGLAAAGDSTGARAARDRAVSVFEATGRTAYAAHLRRALVHV